MPICCCEPPETLMVAAGSEVPPAGAATAVTWATAIVAPTGIVTCGVTATRLALELARATVSAVTAGAPSLTTSGADCPSTRDRSSGSSATPSMSTSFQLPGLPAPQALLAVTRSCPPVLGVKRKSP
jgi:hypothetical protein